MKTPYHIRNVNKYCIIMDNRISKLISILKDQIGLVFNIPTKDHIVLKRQAAFCMCSWVALYIRILYWSIRSSMGGERVM